ncbi:hypothetical protein G7Z17_g5778 [Cylindrodendrum hubeiense]|uniref:TauD/TfdA-like domain-containing protein n=1 Tax=Cylindrodendrum hubeiense TaxID=595255 RepID=A0A9P5H620_9HYPO|nr:hypothetical protein G7Z17_g5778 [Cylindrodendrum hubeiense]
MPPPTGHRDGDAVQASKRERGRVAQREYRKRHASRFQNLQEENQRLKNAIQKISQVASSTERRGQDLEDAISEAVSIAGIQVNDQSPAEETSSSQDSELVSLVDPPPIREILSEQRTSTNQSETESESLSQGSQSSLTLDRQIWLDTDRLVRIYDAPSDVLPFLGDGLFTIAGCLYWACTYYAITLWKKMKNIEEPELSDQSRFDRMFNHSKHLVDRDFLMSIAQARLDFRKKGYIDRIHLEEYHAENEAMGEVHTLLQQEYADKNETLQWWRKPQEVETYIKQHLTADELVELQQILQAAVVQPPVPVGPVGQPDIAYTPNYDSYVARVKRRQETETLDRTLPTGFPEKLVSDLVWDGRDLAKSYDWDYYLTEDDLKELDEGLRSFKALDVPLGQISQETFVLPKLHDTLRAISREIHQGHGFKVVRGVPVDKYTREENIIIYAGLASHIAPVRGRQDHLWQGKPADVVISHIKDISREVDASRIGAPAYTAEKQVFHTDAGDVIALFALGEAAEGGQSYLSSSWHVYNELAATRPDLVRTLAEPWASDEFGRAGKRYTLRPLVHHQPATAKAPERLIIQYARRQFTGYWGLPRSSDIPPITEAQAEALDTLHFLAEKYAASLNFHKGDIQFVNNLSIFHARGGFKDSSEKQRHLVRLWLRDPELAWETPEVLQPRDTEQ